MEKQKAKYPPGKHPKTLANLAKGRAEGKGFKPGQSGNPKGRPPGIRYVSEALRDLLASDEALVDKLARNLANRAKKKSYDLNLVFERTEGKVTQPIGGGGEITLRVIYDDSDRIPSTSAES